MHSLAQRTSLFGRLGGHCRLKRGRQTSTAVGGRLEAICYVYRRGNSTKLEACVARKLASSLYLGFNGKSAATGRGRPRRP